MSKQTLLKSLRNQAKAIFLRPKTFFTSKAFAIVWTLYAATYTVANASESAAAKWKSSAVEPIKMASTILVNVPLGIWKDVRFAQLFGYGQAAPATATAATATTAAGAASVSSAKTASLPTIRVPRTAMAAFLLRDSLTIFGGFCLPGLMTDFIKGKDGTVSHTHTVVAQLTVPALTQVVATPVHLIGLDICSPQHSGTVPQRMSRISHSLVPATVARCVRILPAFGVGVIANTELRSYFNSIGEPGGQKAESADVGLFTEEAATI